MNSIMKAQRFKKLLLFLTRMMNPDKYMEIQGWPSGIFFFTISKWEGAHQILRPTLSFFNIKILSNQATVSLKIAPPSPKKEYVALKLIGGKYDFSRFSIFYSPW